MYLHRLGLAAAAATVIGLSAFAFAEQQRGVVSAATEAGAERVASREAVRQALEKRGYNQVVVAEGEVDAPPVAFACQGGDDYRLRLDAQGGVVARERIGRCGSKDAVAVRAPYAHVDVDDESLRVRAPFADVHVDKTDGSVSVRAPFVDLKIGR